jgi:hypothetical protein
MNAGGLNCAICESANCGESSWYLVIENRWQDRLKILNGTERSRFAPA